MPHGGRTTGSSRSRSDSGFGTGPTTLDLRTGDRIGRFEIQGQLGTGGMGIVYAAYDPQRDRTVALKMLKQTGREGGGFPTSLYAFKREFRALSDIAHQNLVQLYELVSDDDRWFFTMEAVRGVPPLEYIRSGYHQGDEESHPFQAGEFDAARTLRPLMTAGQYRRLRETLLQVTSGLIALHRGGMVHRDIKPSNILVTEEARAVVLDFGLIAEVSASREVSDVTVVGTAAYMAPEQAAGDEVGPAADFYSLGVLLYEAITGLWPFDGPPIRMLMLKQEREAPALTDLVPDAPSDLAELCARLLQRNPENRPTGEELLRVLGGSKAVRLNSAGSAPESSGTPPFVGRDAEMAVLRSAYEESRDRTTAPVIIRGESGVGKTALVRQFLQLLSQEPQGAVILTGRCNEREQVPYKAFDGIVDALSRFLKRIDPIEAALLLPDDASLLARMFPVLARVPVIARMPGIVTSAIDLSTVRARAFAALRTLIERISRRWPLVLFVDDLQWADADSVALLADLLDPRHVRQLLFIATVRTEGLPVHLRDTMTTQIAARIIDLESLSRDESVHLTHLLYRRITAKHAADQTARRVADESLGHPLFIDELVRYLGEVGDQGELLLDEALWARIQLLQDEARELLEVVAVGGLPMKLETVAAAAGLLDQDWSKWASILRIGNLVKMTGSRSHDTIEPYHDRVRDSVLHHLSSRRKRQLHRLIADELQAGGAATSDPHLLVHHLEAAGDAVRAAELALAAARRASDALAFDQAAQLYRVALRLGTHTDDEANRLKRKLADALTCAGCCEEAATVYLDVAATADAATRLECQRLAAEQLLCGGHVERGFKVLSAVLTDSGVQIPERPVGALASLLWQRSKLRLRGVKWEQRDPTELAEQDLKRLDIYTTVATSMALVDNIRGADFHARALLLALKLGEPKRVVQGLAIESMMLASQGGRPRKRARRLVEEVVRIGESRQDPDMQIWAVGARAFEQYFAGRYRLAAERLAEAETLINQRAWVDFYASTVRIFRLFSLRFLGEYRQVHQALELYLNDARRKGDLYTASTLTRAFNRHWLCQDDPARARQDLARDLWTPPTDSFHLQHWYQLRALAEVDLYASGSPSMEEYERGFRALERSKLLRIQLVRCDFAWLCGRLALAMAVDATDVKRLLRYATRQVRKLEREPICYAQVWAAMLRGGIAWVRGASDQAVQALRQAAELADQHDLRLLKAGVQRRLGEILAGSEGERWRRKADGWMLSEGIRNPESMAQLLVPGFDSH